MTGKDLKSGRERKGWTQAEAASKLRISQPYLSLMEKGARPIPQKFARLAASALKLSAATLPLDTGWDRVQPPPMQTLAEDLASLGYPGFAFLRSRRKKNPVEVLLSALSANCLEARVTEALPWLLLAFTELDWESLICAAKVQDLQNKLGFIVCVARKVAEKRRENNLTAMLRERELLLERSRLLREDAFCPASLTHAERKWLETNRSSDAKHWRVLTDLSAEHLNYVD